MNLKRGQAARTVGSSTLTRTSGHLSARSGFWAVSFLLLILPPASAQVAFQRIIGTADADSARWVDRTTDGGYVIAGMSAADGNQAYVVKLDPLGAVQWDSLFGAAGTQRAYRVLQTPDGGYVVAGETDTTSNPPQGVLLAKLDSCGNVLWANLFVGTPLWARPLSTWCRTAPVAASSSAADGSVPWAWSSPPC